MEVAGAGVVAAAGVVVAGVVVVGVVAGVVAGVVVAGVGPSAAAGAAEFSTIGSEMAPPTPSWAGAGFCTSFATLFSSTERPAPSG